MTTEETKGPLLRAGRERLESAIERYRTGPLSLCRSLIEGLAALDEERAMSPQCRHVLDEHLGGWFALAPDVRDLLDSIDQAATAPRAAGDHGGSPQRTPEKWELGASQRQRLETLAATVIPPGIAAGGVGALRNALHALDQGAALAAQPRAELQHWLDTEAFFWLGAPGNMHDDDALRALLEVLDAR